MSQHLHCPSCDHCTDWHKLAQAQKALFLPPAGPILLMCAGCEPGESGAPLCPAGEKPESRTETLRLMFIGGMRDMITETGL